MGSRRHTLYLNEEEGRVVADILQGKGYETYPQMAQALAGTEGYKGRAISCSYLSMALHGKRGIPEAMIYSLLELTGDEERLHFLRRGLSPIQPIARDHWEGIFLDYIHQLRELYEGATRKGRLEALQGLEKVVQLLEKK